MYVKGVNLGNWLVLEKWMSPALFEGTEAEDEYNLPYHLSEEVYQARIKVHRSEYISERDFIRIRKMGIDTVRIPVPYFIFGDRKPFIGCVEELDKAFNWAERYGLQILIDLHTAPDSQNGFDNGGISGVCKWSQEPDEVEFELTVLERLAKRYGMRQGLWGIEVLNEPVLGDMWEKADIPKRYPAADPQKAKGSKGNSTEFIRQFYLDAYDRLRKYLPEEKYIVIHDAFHLKMWKDFMRDEKYKNVVLDTHMYLTVAEMMGCGQTVEDYKAFIGNWEKDIEEMEQYFPVIIGEWCLANSVAIGYDTKGGQTVLNGVENASGETICKEKRKQIYNELGKAQLCAWKKGSGSFYWSYKLLIDTVNDKGWDGWDSWDFGRSADFGWFPAQETEAGQNS